MVKFADRIQPCDNGLSDIFAYANDPALISFAAGYPNNHLFPQNELQTAFNASLTDSASLQYSSAAGLKSLRAKIAAHISDTKRTFNADQILLTQGAQQGLDLTAKLLVNPGDGVVVEAPTYLGALSAFDAYQPTYYEVSLQDDGMDLSVLQKTLMTHSVKFIYTIPDFQNPTGSTLSLAKRHALLQLAERYDVIILEDSPYRDLRFSGDSLPSLASLDTTDHVISLGSFSKILSPGLRLGWLVAAPQFLQPLTELKLGNDVQSSTLVMNAIDQYLTEHDINTHIAKMNRAYVVKMNTMLNALDRYLPATVSFTKPTGGFFIYLTLPAEIDANQLLKQVILPEAKVAYVPSGSLFPVSHQANGIRLNFTNLDNDTIESGVKRLGKILTAVLRQPKYAKL
ncbi:aminotransferase-like domain-containing protein [Loigolactobacillus jiayinensis]|uniref:PLP-dependent aminotransferase family protein n=1 Tax=Loigolactobacillus jiayinensis TaxID=2486016 RepID=A0ABW1RD88_9LACO|nr:PLP-dependent aminotransferase family protein [Loigolactobacillus jiayinensis]